MEFVVLPDHPAAEEVTAQLPEEYRKNTIRHRSGRPWLVGDWPAEAAVHVEAGPSKVVLLGTAHITEPALLNQLEKARSVRDLDRIVDRTAGCFHLVASLDGRVRFQGTLSGAREVFSTDCAGITVASNRVSVLSTLRRLTLAEDQLTLQLLDFTPPWPLSERSVWREIAPLPFAHYLALAPDGTAEPVRWWTPPAPEFPVEVAAPEFRKALASAVAARTSSSPVVGADLSGGMDSTSLCFLAAGQGSRLVTIRRRLMDPVNCEDSVADRAAADLPDAKHIVLEGDSAPSHYEAVDREDFATDEPPPFVAMASHMETVARIMAAHGVTRHLQGHGSDELAATGTTHLNAMAQQSLLGSLGMIRAMRARRRWSLGTTLRVVRKFPPYAEWLRRSAGELLSPPSPESEVGWEPAPHLPPWISGEAAELARETVLRAAATNPAPLSSLPTHHEILRCIRVNGTIVRFSNTLAGHSGVSFEAPYLDDRVVETALSVQLAGRQVMGRHKPVLAAALRGTVPDYVLDRTTKSHFTVDVYEGRRRNLGKLREMCEESRLVDLGLVDRGGFRRALSDIMPDPMHVGPLEKTLACEAWLRSVLEKAAQPQH
ncbi:asparagine synthase-related protein [Streptomyces daliensis]|uniref:Asparagine synthase n=1 Tax=Streptomyces daliensis TaxID=299421 RepID=A0A8T4IRW7_9ACTN|nr:asparagine synthase [Streptomyces daliensis]